MGEFLFIPGSDFNQVGDSPSGKFSINLDQLCDPDYKLMLGVDGALVDYQYTVYTKDPNGQSTTICNGSFTNNGNQVQICIGALFVPGQTYYVAVNYTSNAVIRENISFQVINCETRPNAYYCCQYGLIMENIDPSAGPWTITITKGSITETVSWPFASPVYLEQGFYEVKVNGIPTRSIVDADCSIAVDGYASCSLNSPAVVFQTLFAGGSYVCPPYTPPINFKLDVFDSSNVLVHSEYIDTASSTYRGLLVWNIVPTIIGGTLYTITVDPVDLNSYPFLGSFNTPYPSASFDIIAAECTLEIHHANLKITNIRCDNSGILVDIEEISGRNISGVIYGLYNKNRTYKGGEEEQYSGINAKRTISIPSSMFGGCLDDWFLNLNIVTTTGIPPLLYFYNIPVFIPELFKSLNCLKNCNWPEVCASGSGQST